MAAFERKLTEICKITAFLVDLDKVEAKLPRILIKGLYAAGSIQDIERLLRASLKREYSLELDWLISTLNPKIHMCLN